MKTILITGAAGDVGTHIRRELASTYGFRAADLRPVQQAFSTHETYVKADIAQFSDALQRTQGVDAIIHLGGYAVEGPWAGILRANIIGCYNVFEAARRHGVQRLLFPTSNHAMGFYPRSQTIDHTADIKPDSRYGVSKVFGEALGSLYADKYGMECLMMRLGNVGPVPLDTRRLSLWCSPRDLAQLVTIGLEHPAITCEIVSGISRNTRAWYDNSNAFRLGYEPVDDAETFAAAVLAREQPGQPVAEQCQGGVFCVEEHRPNPAPLPQQKAKRKKT